MARNRKNQSGVRFGSAILALVLCLSLGAAGLGFVWQKRQIQELGLEIRQLENDFEKVRLDNKQAADHLAYLTSPRNLELRVRELDLGLVQPHPSQVLRLWEQPYIQMPADAEINTPGRLSALNSD